MNKTSVVAAAMIAVFAISSPAIAGDQVAQKTHAATKASPKLNQAKRPILTGILDPMSTQSIVKSGKKASPSDAEARGTPSGIAVNPWIVPSFF